MTFIKIIRSATALLVALVSLSSVQAGERYTFKVDESSIHSGYFAYRIPLQHYAKPNIRIIDLLSITTAKIPDNALPSKPERFDIIMGKELKRPFAVVRIPAFMLDADGKTLKRVTEVTIEVTEQATQAASTVSSAKTTAINSPLANGTWYKVSIPKTGLYKVDFEFLTKQLGLSAPIASSTIRVFGNGGNMLSENNAVARPDNLQENGIYVNDGGDGVIDAGDYIIFYAQGPTGWTPDIQNNRYRHTKNIYEDKAYYFFNFDQGAGKRLAQQPTSPVGNVTVNTYNYYDVLNNDEQNIGAFGKVWFSDEFSSRPGQQLTRSYEMNIGQTVGDAILTISGGSYGASINPSYFNVSINGTNHSLMINSNSNGDFPIGYGVDSFKQGIGTTANIRMTYTPVVANGKGFLDYIEVNVYKPLSFTGSSLLFSNISSVGANNIASYNINGATATTQVWDITDHLTPVLMKGNLSGSTYNFGQDASTLHQFAAFNSNALPVPEFVAAVPNQNIHGKGIVDYVIVSHPDLKPAAERLAEFHRQRSALNILVVTTKEVYNEFSSGSQDISAIRDMMRMFYTNAGTDTSKMPRYLLLMGDASYDYKDRLTSNTNLVPTFETKESSFHINYYSCDDFFAFLDDNENIENYNIINTLDIGVGRIPAVTLQEANDVVNKIIHYKSPATLGPWRLSATYVTDDEDGAGNHLEDGEIMGNEVNTQSGNIFNSTKMYLDDINTISTPGGKRAPDANKIINDAIFKGTFLVNYSGHGNPLVMAEERILTPDDYNSWKNLDALPIMVTATCDYGQYDQPSVVSSGERLLLKNDGGVIATLTTTQLVYQVWNRPLNKGFLNAQFDHTGGSWNTFGDALRIGKNNTYAHSTDSQELINYRKFALLGDPALEPNFPEFFIQTEEVRDASSGKLVDTISALGAYTIQGSVTDVNKNVLSNFNGNLSVTIFDKRTRRTVQTNNGVRNFDLLNNIIYRGKATVVDGKFSFTFVAPKDINYEFGKSKMSLYAENGVTDAAGVDQGYTVGGYSDNPQIENTPPIVKPYIGDSLFRNGGLTGSNTLLFAILEDETGINVSGNAVGHDMTAVLDEDIANPYILNDYYETAPNTYQRGYVSFPIYNIPEGRHRLTVKAWDVNNNSGTGTVDFVVADGNIMKVQQLSNYPNPFRDVTHFVFEHNHPNENLTIEINVYNTAGSLVRKIRQDYLPSTSTSREITWDGTDNHGSLLPSGVYIYRMKLVTKQGIEDMAYQKLVIVR